MKHARNQKLYILLSILFVMVIVVSGCGGGTQNTSSNTANQAQAAEPTAESTAKPAATSTPEPAETGTRIIKTAMGDLEVPVNPQRVVVNWYIGDVFTLGIKPVALNAWSQETMPFFDQFAGIPKIENWEAEDILTYDPDLIITYDPQDFEKLSKIAPVLVIPEGDVNTTERLAILGEATGHEAEAQAAIATFEQKLAEAKEQLGADIFKDKTFSIFEDWGRDSYGIYYETGSRGGTLLYEYLGLKKPEKMEQLVTSSGEGRGSLSYEVASEYFGDYVLWFLQEDKESEYAKTEIWNSIPAVQAGHIVEIPGEYSGLFYYSDVASMTAQLDYIIGRLLEQVK
ncbi:ABC transporter substrate-binding protein [Paenibacillus donghaensis]|uniref:Fe3+-hydroxamate ABC transporter substrate-binding protein n=1 Tax=Paenibacillus donghaensis TaxID=414771 RepID=A0A2Z2KNQ0_9BACL|nr:ABC transporter substrate-binding protein [Paenibacillus donghaensis]ASA20408.1 Fe3+-hydroxamate ABC transporter substrate-binding protein [Paenibacillus donghaensis]